MSDTMHTSSARVHGWVGARVHVWVGVHVWGEAFRIRRGMPEIISHPSPIVAVNNVTLVLVAHSEDLIAQTRRRVADCFCLLHQKSPKKPPQQQPKIDQASLLMTHKMAIVEK